MIWYNKHVKKFILIIIFALLILFFPHTAFAQDQDSDWTITTFRSDIVVQKTGDVQITELVAVDFNTLKKHGIYRDIPYVYLSNGRYFYTDIVVKNIMQDGTPAKYNLYDNGSYKRIQIGDSDYTISGKHAYIITYLARGTLRSFSDQDELYWNVTGDNWSVPISNVIATVTLPKDSIMKVACYQGVQNSKELCSAKIENGKGIFSSTRVLTSSEQMSVIVGYKKGLVPILVVERPKSFIEKFLSLNSLLLATVLSVLSIGFIIRKWYSTGREKAEGLMHDTVVVEYTPPEKLRPAEIGVLMDEKADTLDVTATVIDLTTRGYMTITELPKKWLFGKTDYLLKQTNKSASGLLSYEQLLLDRLFAEGKEIKMSDLKDSFYKDLKDVKKALYKDMMDKKLFVGNPESIRNTYLAFAIIIAVIGSIIFSAAVIASFVYIADIAFALIFFGLTLLIVSRSMPRRTAAGHELYRRIKGYREFIDHVEQYRQQFFEKENMFNEVLPYAIVFGLTKKFAEAMKQMGVTNAQPYGYYGLQSFSAINFTSSINSFSNSFSSAIASAPSSSSGFSSGGGFSGGGFGGGGGGSW